MENSLSILIASIILDLLSALILKKLFKLKVGYFMIFAMQIICVMPIVAYLFLHLSIFQLILIKLFVWFIFVLLVTDSYYFKNIFVLWFWQVILMFSVYGTTMFLIEFTKAIFENVFKISIGSNLNFVVVFGLLCYFVAVFGFVSFFENIKTLKSFLTKVSFSIFGKHIVLTGLVDSGNSLYDTKTGKAVVVVSVKAFKDILPKSEYLKLASGDFSALPISHKINFVSINGKESDMPVFDVGSITVKTKSKTKEFKCVLGFTTNELVSDRSFECLLHKDLI